MQTSLDCLACFMQQALTTARLSSGDETVQREILSEMGRLVAHLDMALSPPENAIQVYNLIADISGEKDPFADAKKKSTELALALRDDVRSRIQSAENPLRTAVRYAIASNIIDYGVQHEFNVLDSLDTCLGQEFLVDDFILLEDALRKSPRPSILYLADNCGELVFDGLLIEQFLQEGCSVILVVREDIILNDVTMREVKSSEMSDLCPVITSGTVCPGTPLHLCSDTMQETFHSADMIISKGQGNFETLSDVDAPLFFLLTAKCKVVAGHLAEMKCLAPESVEGKGEMILMRKERVQC